MPTVDHACGLITFKLLPTPLVLQAYTPASKPRPTSVWERPLFEAIWYFSKCFNISKGYFMVYVNYSYILTFKFSRWNIQFIESSSCLFWGMVSALALLFLLWCTEFILFRKSSNVPWSTISLSGPIPHSLTWTTNQLSSTTYSWIQTHITWWTRKVS